MEAATVRGERVYGRLLQRRLRNRTLIQRHLLARPIGSRGLSGRLRSGTDLRYDLQAVAHGARVRSAGGSQIRYPKCRAENFLPHCRRGCFFLYYWVQHGVGHNSSRAIISACSRTAIGWFCCLGVRGSAVNASEYRLLFQIPNRQQLCGVGVEW